MIIYNNISVSAFFSGDARELYVYIAKATNEYGTVSAAGMGNRAFVYDIVYNQDCCSHLQES